MKNFVQVILLAGLLLTSFVASSQVYLKPTVFYNYENRVLMDSAIYAIFTQNDSTLYNSLSQDSVFMNSINYGGLKAEIMGSTGNYSYFMYDPYNPIDTVLSDSIGFDWGQGIAIQANAVNSTMTDTFRFIIVPDYQTMSIDFNVLSSTSSGTCDGGIFASHRYDYDTVYNNPPTTFLYNLYSSLSPNTPIPSTDLNWNNLCSDRYLFEIVDPQTGTYFMGDILLNSLSSVNNNPNFTVSVLSSPSGLFTSCTGSAKALVFGSTSPYSFSWDGGVFAIEDSISNLCSGIHTLRVVDSNNDTLGVTFGVADSAHFYTDTIYNPVVIDTISFNTQNCSFDYNQPVDSGYITNLIVIDSNTAYFELDIWQGGVMSQYADTITVEEVPLGNNMVSIVFYCGNKTISGSTYQIISYVNITTNSIKEFEKQDYLIYPNPSSGIFHIQMDKFKSARIMNTLGEIVLEGGTKNINLSGFDIGLYFITIEDIDGNQFTEKLILK